MPVYSCPRCGGPITDVAGALHCPNSPCQYGHDEPRKLVPESDRPYFLSEIGDFESFWKKYPRKTAKAVAKRSWVKLNPDADTMIAIFAALEWQCNSKQWADDGIIPHPATWLNQRRWEDEPPTAIVPTSPRPPKPPLKSFAEQNRERAAMLRRAGVARPGEVPPTQRPLPRPNTLTLPAHAGDDQ